MGCLTQFMQQMVDARKALQCQSSRPTCTLPTNPTKYICFEEFVIANGKEYVSEPLTPDENRIFIESSKRTLLYLQKRDFPIKECFVNSQRLMFGDRSNLIRYVEGYVLCGGIIPFPIHHGWLDLNGKVIDVTLRSHPDDPPVSKRRRDKFANRAIGEFSPCREYFGVVFSDDYVKQYMEETMSLGSLIDDVERGFPLMMGKVPF